MRFDLLRAAASLCLGLLAAGCSDSSGAAATGGRSKDGGGGVAPATSNRDGSTGDAGPSSGHHADTGARDDARSSVRDAESRTSDGSDRDGMPPPGIDAA